MDQRSQDYRAEGTIVVMKDSDDHKSLQTNDG